MIDLHNHILPGIDDGAPDSRAALALAKAAQDSGITHCIFTPHIHIGYFNNTLEQIKNVHESFKISLLENGLTLKTHYAAEVRITPDIVSLKQTHQLPYIGTYHDNFVLLLELPHSHIPAGTEQLLSWLKKQNIKPMIAHPERNRDILADYNKAHWLKGQGVLFQLTAGSVVGTFGERVTNISNKLLKDGLIDIVASDTHNLGKRPPEMDKAYQFLSKNYGESEAQKYCVDTPWSIGRYWLE